VKKQSITTCLKNIVIQAMICIMGITWMIKNIVELQITNQQLKHMKKESVITESPDCWRSFQLGSGGRTI
jgi:anaerobic C4-dicarboxylate transporter